MPKISNIPADSVPVSSDYIVGNQSSGPSTKTFTLLILATYFWTLANIPTGATSPITRDGESQFAFVASGMVWSGDSYAVNRNASMTAGVCYINGRRISIAAVTARTFAASVDTYIDVLDNGDGTGTLVYTTSVNNAASQVLAANSLRIGIIVTGATTIAAAGSVNQGQPTAVLPIASSVAYTTTDSLGNLICNRDPQSKLLGYRQTTSGYTTATTTDTAVTGISIPVIIPANRKAKVFTTVEVDGTAANINYNIRLWSGASLNALTTQLDEGSYFEQQGVTGNSAGHQSVSAFGIIPATTTPQTIWLTLGTAMSGASTIGLVGASTNPVALVVELY